MSDLPALTVQELEQAVAGGAAAIRTVTRLQPAGGPGDKVFPPTYATGDNKLKYATEERRIGGETVPTVLLDSVASQANRMEEALLEGWDTGELSFPVIAVDFTKQAGITDLDRITTLDAPHRIADALLRDSVTEDGVLFRDTEIGKAYTDASTRNATAVFQNCPTALVFGVWDSTGPKGGMGAKFQRALVSEIVGVASATGVKTASRIDPAGIQANVAVYHRKDNQDDWTILEDDAAKKGGKAVPFSRKGAEGKGKPSAVNHSNVAPSIDRFAGGVTLDYAVQTTVLSMPALRRLKFVHDAEGNVLNGEARRKGELAARTALAALGLAGITYLRRQGYDLRSRSLLVPDPGGALVLEVIGADGGEPTRYRMSTDQAAKLLAEAHDRAKATGFGWVREPLKLHPAPKLAELIRESRRLAAERGSDEAGEAGN